MSVVWGEAWRNLLTGTTRGLLFAVVFAVACGGAAVAQSRMVVDFIHQATAYREAGAAIQVVAAPGQINGSQCDDLAQVSGIVAAGALRHGADVTVATLPSTKVPSLDVTPGFAALLDPTSVTTARAGAGVWLAASLAERAGVGLGASHLPLADGEDVPVAGVYAYPADGRAPTLDYAIVSPTASSAPFDACWVFAWPRPEAAFDVLTVPVLPQLTGSGVKAAPPMTSQLNTTLGLSFDGPAKFAALPLWLLAAAGALVGLVLGFTAVRLRRLELAGALHAGVAKPALGVQLLVETLLWLVVAACPSLVASLGASMWGNSDWWPAWWPAIRAIGLAAVATLVGTLAALLLTREKQLFVYFKRR
ncbi:MAG: hypothetical protein LBV00_01100 [Propionibacteriaceae bacterium]|nr:hypothetical protein [Propionibacteriaceae bacterium]